MNAREWDELVVERTNAFEKRLEDYFKNREGERGERWQEESLSL